MTLTRMMEIATKYANGEEEERLGVASTKQSPTKLEEETPVGNRSARPSQLLLVKP